MQDRQEELVAPSLSAWPSMHPGPGPSACWRIWSQGSICSKLVTTMPEAQDLKVFISTGEFTCDDCGQKLDRHAWICLAGERGALCLSCADLAHLVFLPPGIAALTRRARKYST